VNSGEAQQVSVQAVLVEQAEALSQQVGDIRFFRLGDFLEYVQFFFVETTGHDMAFGVFYMTGHNWFSFVPFGLAILISSGLAFRKRKYGKTNFPQGKTIPYTVSSTVFQEGNHDKTVENGGCSKGLADQKVHKAESVGGGSFGREEGWW